MNDPNEEQRELGDSIPETAAEAADVASEIGIETVVETVIYGIDGVATFVENILD